MPSKRSLLARRGDRSVTATPRGACTAPRCALAAIIAIGALAPTDARAQSIHYTVADEHCTGARDVVTMGGELTAFNLSADRPNDTTDVLYNLTTKEPGSRTCGTSLDGTIGANWQVPPPQNVVFIVITFPEGEIFVDSGDPVATAGAFGATAVQRVGDSHADLTTTAGIVLPDAPGTYDADLGAGAETFPRATATGIELAFAPVLDVNDTLVTFCTVGGDVVNPGTGAGIIIGYLVWRIEDTAPTPGAPPPDADFFRLGEAVDFVPVGGPPDPSASLSRLVDRDGLPLSGDEALVYHDAPRNPDGSPRAHGTAARRSRSYWYAVQTVIDGSPAAWGAVTPCGAPAGDRRMDLDGDTIYDAVDLDLDGSPEFISPHAEWGLPGIGLTNDGVPHLSHAIHWPRSACVEPSSVDLDAAAQPLRVTRPAAGTLHLTWEELGSPSYAVFSGTIAAFRTPPHYDHARADTPAAATTDLVEPAADAYFLVAAECAGALLSPLGRDSFGREIPEAP